MWIHLYVYFYFEILKNNYLADFIVPLSMVIEHRVLASPKPNVNMTIDEFISERSLLIFSIVWNEFVDNNVIS